MSNSRLYTRIQLANRNGNYIAAVWRMAANSSTSKALVAPNIELCKPPSDARAANSSTSKASAAPSINHESHPQMQGGERYAEP